MPENTQTIMPNRKRQRTSGGHQVTRLQCGRCGLFFVTVTARRCQCKVIKPRGNK